jgi:formamidopyrimidine-DNA glycosylase
MPELPDVEVFREYCRQNVLDRKIDRLTIKNSRVMKSSPSTLRKHLEGAVFRETGRHGKYLFLATDKRELVLHFGMTGQVRFMDEHPEKKDHSPLIIYFDDGTCFAYITVRKLGQVLLIDDRNTFIEKKQLGPDAMDIDGPGFQKALERGGGIKSRLMNQKKLAGIGNVYADEILYQTGILPERKSIDRKETDRLFNTMQRIFEVSIRHNADPGECPERYLIKRREQGTECGICEGRISKKTISGRATFFCSRHQH